MTQSLIGYDVSGARQTSLLTLVTTYWLTGASRAGFDRFDICLKRHELTFHRMHGKAPPSKGEAPMREESASSSTD